MSLNIQPISFASILILRESLQTELEDKKYIKINLKRARTWATSVYKELGRASQGSRIQNASAIPVEMDRADNTEGCSPKRGISIYSEAQRGEWASHALKNIF
jgi:hypothetical protein